MEKALYDPKTGYYASGKAALGRNGDFFTNVSIGKIYGKMIALFIDDLWEKLNKPSPFCIVEQGAHDGMLAQDILEELRNSPALFSSTSYIIVEPFPILRKRQQERLREFSNVYWFSYLCELPPWEGIHFSNELIDAFPVHLLTWNGEQWLEQRVCEEEDQKSYSWLHAPIEEEELERIAVTLPRSLSPGFLCEIRLGISSWLAEIAKKLKRGMILIADYGYVGSSQFAPYRAEGSIACYQKHQRFNNPLEKPGERDISVHVNFGALAQTALQQNWSLLGFSDQHHFLMGIAHQWLKSLEEEMPTASRKKELRSLQTLLHPETMGRQFQFLGLGHAMLSTPPLSGFRYQRPGISGLF